MKGRKKLSQRCLLEDGRFVEGWNWILSFNNFRLSCPCATGRLSLWRSFHAQAIDVIQLSHSNVVDKGWSLVGRIYQRIIRWSCATTGEMWLKNISQQFHEEKRKSIWTLTKVKLLWTPLLLDLSVPVWSCQCLNSSNFWINFEWKINFSSQQKFWNVFITRTSLGVNNLIG